VAGKTAAAQILRPDPSDGSTCFTMTAYSHAAAVQKIKSAKEGKGSKPNASKPRLYAKGTFLGFRR
jgi:hypothetical protein